MITIDDLKLLSRYDALQESYDDEINSIIMMQKKYHDSEFSLELIEAAKQDKVILKNQVMPMVEVLNKCSNLTKQIIDLRFIQRLEINEILPLLYISKRTMFRYLKRAIHEFECVQHTKDKCFEEPYEFQGFTI